MVIKVLRITNCNPDEECAKNAPDLQIFRKNSAQYTQTNSCSQHSAGNSKIFNCESQYLIDQPFADCKA